MSGRGRTLRIATRTSALARRQAERVAGALENRRFSVELVEVEATGDQVRDELIHELGTTGAFVRALDEQVIDGEVDAAVHSMKDVPTESTDDLVVAAIPERGPAGDVLVTPDGSDLQELPREAVVGTGSLRRQAQLLDARPDLTVEPLRGNVDTRIEKLLAPHLQAERADRERQAELDEENAYRPSADEDGNVDATDADGDDAVEADEDDAGAETDDASAIEEEDADPVAEWIDSLAPIERRALDRSVETSYDAIVLAEAGLDRLALLDQVPTSQLAPASFVSAPGQGAIAVTMCDTDDARSVNEVVDDPRTRIAVTVERTILAELGGGCIAPLGVHAVVKGGYVDTTVRVLDRDGERTIGTSAELPIERHRDAARDLAAELAEEGAADLVREAKRTVTDS
jgi:hydroxymethylbilane synthase